MKREELLRAMGNIDESLISGAVEEPKKKRNRVRWGLVAACICLLVGMAVVAVASPGARTHLMSTFTGRPIPGFDDVVSGYSLQVDLEKIPASALTGQIQEVSEFLKQQCSETAEDSGYWRVRFASAQEAREYIGLAGLRPLTWNLEEKENLLHIEGDKTGEIHTVTMETEYKAGDMVLQAFSDIWTENAPFEPSAGSVANDYMEYTESFYTTNSGRQCHILRAYAQEAVIWVIDSYMVENGVLYRLHIAYFTEADAEQAESLLHQWAEQLG